MRVDDRAQVGTGADEHADLHPERVGDALLDPGGDLALVLLGGAHHRVAALQQRADIGEAEVGQQHLQLGHGDLLLATDVDSLEQNRVLRHVTLPRRQPVQSIDPAPARWPRVNRMRWVNRIRPSGVRARSSRRAAASRTRSRSASSRFRRRIATACHLLSLCSSGDGRADRPGSGRAPIPRLATTTIGVARPAPRSSAGGGASTSPVGCFRSPPSVWCARSRLRSWRS